MPGDTPSILAPLGRFARDNVRFAQPEPEPMHLSNTIHVFSQMSPWLVGLVLFAVSGCAQTDPIHADATISSQSLDTTSTWLACISCVNDSDCATGHCVLSDGDWYCALPCSSGTTNSCPTSTSCQATSDPAGGAIYACVSPQGACTDPDDSDAAGCGWDPPGKASCCTCGPGNTCAANGCYNGWMCTTSNCTCHPAAKAPPCAIGPSADVPWSAEDLAANDPDKGVPELLDKLDFAIIGDTRPPNKDATSTYPTAIITRIWQDLAAETPAVPFAVTTGDYVFSSTDGVEASKQLDLYLSAQALFSGSVWHAMGNHECTGATASNCGTNNSDGITGIYQTYMAKVLAKQGLTRPYYVKHFAAKDGSWTARMIFIAANAWDDTQAAWLKAVLQQPSTYTFLLRHESSSATTAPGTSPSQKIALASNFTLMICGHSHIYQYDGKREVIVGNGGAPLTGGANYGYVVARQRPDGAMQFTAYDYKSHAVMDSFALHADGTTAAIP